MLYKVWAIGGWFATPLRRMVWEEYMVPAFSVTPDGAEDYRMFMSADVIAEECLKWMAKEGDATLEAVLEHISEVVNRLGSMSVQTPAGSMTESMMAIPAMYAAVKAESVDRNE